MIGLPSTSDRNPGSQQSKSDDDVPEDGSSGSAHTPKSEVTSADRNQPRANLHSWLRWWRIPAAALVGLLLFLALAAWSVSSPWGSSPDDDYHTAMVYCEAGDAECVREGERASVCYAFKTGEPADCVDASSLSVPTTTGVITGWYPPLYYMVSGLFIDSTVAATSRNIRLANAGLAVALIVGSVALSRRSIRPAVAVSWLVSSVPLGVFLFASINPSGWGVLGVAAMWGPLLSVLTTEKFTGRQAWGLLFARLAFIQLAVLMSLGARSEPPVYVGILTAALVIMTFPARPSQWRTPRILIFVVPLIIGLQALLFLRVFTGEKVANRQSGSDDPLGPWQVFDDSVALPVLTLMDPVLGWLDTPMPMVTRALVTGAYAGAFLVGLGVMYWRKAAGVLFYFLASWAFVALVLASSSKPEQLQSRYFLASIFGLVGLALLPRLGDRTRVLTVLQAVLLAVAISVANFAALLWNSLRYVTGLDGASASAGGLLNADVPDWWISPLSPGATWLMGSAVFAIAAVGGILLTLSSASTSGSASGAAASGSGEAIRTA